MKRLVAIPFSGFDSDDWQFHLQEQMSFEGEMLAQSDESEVPLEAEDYESIIDDLWNQNNRSLKYLAQEYLNDFASEVRAHLKLPLSFDFDRICFTDDAFEGPDRIFARIGIRQIRALFETSARDGHKSLRSEVKEMFESRGIYFSFYDDDPEQLLSKPLQTWDHNELQVLLLAVFPSFDERAICEGMTENGTFLEAFWRGMNKRRFKREVAALRRERSG